MNPVALFLLAAAAAATPAAPVSEEPRGVGAQVASAQVSVKILRPAVLKDGSIGSDDPQTTQRVQTLKREQRITYEFE